MSVPPRLPPGIPPGLVSNLTERMIGQGAPATGMPSMPPPTMPPGGVGTLPAPPPQEPPPPGGPPPGPQQPPPTGAPPPGGPQPQGTDDDGGLKPEIAETLRDLMRKKKSRDDIMSIVRQVQGEERGGASLKIDPGTRLKLAQGWNVRVAESSELLVNARGQNPGASKASDEALLRAYWTTPLDVKLEDIDEYAEAVRQHLVQVQGLTDEDEIEDTTMRWCFPLRDLVIKAGRRNQPRKQVEFVNEMLKLTDRWFDKYGEIPEPDWTVLQATKAGKGDPESQARETDSDPFPPGKQDLLS